MNTCFGSSAMELSATTATTIPNLLRTFLPQITSTDGSVLPLLCENPCETFFDMRGIFRVSGFKIC